LFLFNLKNRGFRIASKFPSIKYFPDFFQIAYFIYIHNCKIWWITFGNLLLIDEQKNKGIAAQLWAGRKRLAQYQSAGLDM
jgi:hypothetical protein